MFTFQTALDQVVKGSKSTLTYVQDKDVRKSIENVIDMNADFAKSVFDYNIELAQLVVEKLGSNEITKPWVDFAKKFQPETK